MSGHGRAGAKRRREATPIGLVDRLVGLLTEAGDESTELAGQRLVVGHQEHLVRLVERHQPATAEPPADEEPPAVVAEDRLDEALAEGGVVESALFLEWQVRQATHQLAREMPDAGALRRGVPGG